MEQKIRREVLKILNKLQIPYICDGVVVGNCDICGSGGGATDLSITENAPNDITLGSSTGVGITIKGEAIDLDGDAPSATWVSVDNNVLFHWIRKNLVYDQLIAEFEANGRPKWVHASYRAVGNRQQTLIATKNSAGKTVYMNFTDNLYSKIYKGSRDRSFSLEDVFEMPDTDYHTFLAEGEGVNEVEVTGNKQRLEPEEEAILDVKEETLLGKGPLPVIEENKDGSFSLIVPAG